MVIEYEPRGVCSRHMTVEVEGGIIRSVAVVGGCDGNLQGIASLLRGMRTEEAIARLEGIRCNGKPTSCPDQLAQALKTAQAQR
ncbi:MAG TPA: TIGR03905 family TSCPD domain-containing protein [Oscillospiraceae bacterium]|nr:TIGR03905 family TSCPD domain-containing protein [Oscillospiraceae bacterium]